MSQPQDRLELQRKNLVLQIGILIALFDDIEGEEKAKCTIDLFSLFWRNREIMLHTQMFQVFNRVVGRQARQLSSQLHSYPVSPWTKCSMMNLFNAVRLYFLERNDNEDGDEEEQ